MILLGNLLCASLSLCALVASASAGTRLSLRAGADWALGVLLLWFAVVLVPVHVLGALNVLWPGPLALASVVTSLTVFGLSAIGVGFRGLVSATAQAVAQTSSHFRVLVVNTFRAGPLAIAALAAIFVALVWTSLLTYLLPSDAWDGVWYHDLMVGYTIQQHGYADAAMPMEGIQQANGYPRNSEMLSVWFVIFSDRKFIELPSVIAAIPLALATYGLCQRYGRDGASSLLWAAGMVLLPGARLEMRTTYVDLLFGALTVSAFYFATDPKLDGRRSVIASVALGLALGSKGHALFVVPFLMLSAVFILWKNVGWRRIGRVAIYVGTGMSIILFLGCLTYLLNWIRRDNPLWPIEMSLGPIEFKGVLPYKRLDESTRFDVISNLYSVPVPGKDFADTRVTGYGFVGFFALPLAALALCVLVFSSIRLTLRAIIERRWPERLGEGYTLLFLSGVAGFTLWRSTAVWQARYHLAAVAVGFVLVHWLSVRFSRSNALSLGAGSAMFVTNLAMWWWSDPGWGSKGIVSGVRDVAALFRIPAAERAAVSVLHDPTMVAARERELKKGDIAVWSDDAAFPALLWNERHTNVLKYEPLTYPPSSFADTVERLGARWVAVGGRYATVLSERTDRWQQVSMTHKNHGSTPVFRRLR